MVGAWPLIAVGWPAFLTSTSVPRSTLPTWAKMPITATTVAHRRPITTIFKWVPRSALYIEWFIASLPYRPLDAAEGSQGSFAAATSYEFLPQHAVSPNVERPVMAGERGRAPQPRWNRQENLKIIVLYQSL